MNRLSTEDEARIKKIAGYLYKKYCPMAESGFFSKEDIYHHGVIGFMDAKRRFDPSKKVPFHAYAAIRIQGEIMDALRRGPQIRLPQEKQTRVKQLLAAKNAIIEQGKTPDIDRLKGHLGWDEAEIHRIEATLVSVQSADHNPMVAIARDGDARAGQEKEVLNKDLGRVMQKCLDGLEQAAERMILVARQIQGTKLKVLAERFGCAIETIRQREIRAKKKMKDCLKKHGWTPEQQ